MKNTSIISTIRIKKKIDYKIRINKKKRKSDYILVTSRVHLTVCTVDFTVFTVAVTVFLTFVFLNFESENTGCHYR